MQDRLAKQPAQFRKAKRLSSPTTLFRLNTVPKKNAAGYDANRIVCEESVGIFRDSFQLRPSFTLLGSSKSPPATSNG